IKNTTDTLAYLSGTKELQDHLVNEQGLILPDWAQQHVSATPRNLQSLGQYRSAYVPHAYNPDGGTSLDDLAQTLKDMTAKGSSVTSNDVTSPNIADILQSANLLGTTQRVDPRIAVQQIVNQKDPFLQPR